MEKLIFPPLALSEWRETRDTLHKYCRLVGAIREALSKPLPYSQHTNLLFCRRGFTTTSMPKNDSAPDQLFEVIIDLIHGRLRIESNFREPLYISLTGQSLSALCDETCSLLIDIGIKPPLERPSFLEGVRGQFNSGPVKAYWKVISSTNRVLKRIKRELGKETGPIQLHVDNLTLSLTWYCKKVFGDPSLEQIDLGFSTGDEKFSDTHFFISPFPNGKELKKLIPPECRYRFTEDSSEIILPYSEISKAKNSEQNMFDFFSSVLK